MLNSLGPVQLFHSRLKLHSHCLSNFSNYKKIKEGSPGQKVSKDHLTYSQLRQYKLRRRGWWPYSPVLKLIVVALGKLLNYTFIWYYWSRWLFIPRPSSNGEFQFPALEIAYFPWELGCIRTVGQIIQIISWLGSYLQLQEESGGVDSGVHVWL